MSSTTPFVLTLAAALLVGAATGQQFSPSRTLPLDDTPAPAAGNQRRPTVALGPNGISLVAWQDDRSSLLETVFGITGESNLPGNFDIQAMLLDAQGQPLASTPILVNGDTWDQERPRVAWNGSAWLVVFESTKPTTVFYSRGIYAVRIAADGTVLDHTPLRVDDDDNVDEMFPVVASLGGNWLVAWSDVGANGAELQGAIVGPAGTVGSRQTLLAGSGSAVRGFTDDLAGFCLCIGDDLCRLLFRISAGVCRNTGIFQSLCDLLFAGLHHVQQWLVDPGVQCEEHNAERNDLNDEQTEINTKCFHWLLLLIYTTLKSIRNAMTRQ